MIAKIIGLILSNLTLVLAIIAILIVIIKAISRRLRNKLAATDYFLKWMLLLPSGVSLLYGFVMHAFFPNFTASFIGWQPSPFQFEVALANLSFGVMCVLCARANFSFRVATVIGISIFSLGAAIGHIKQMIVAHNFAPGNAGSIFYTDIIIPLLLLLALLLRNRWQKLSSL